MADIINLNKKRKAKVRLEKEIKASENRIKFGRTKKKSNKKNKTMNAVNVIWMVTSWIKKRKTKDRKAPSPQEGAWSQSINKLMKNSRCPLFPVLCLEEDP